MKSLKHIACWLFISVSLAVHAVPADPKPFIHIQPDGTTLLIYLKGDESLSWAETQDGYTLLPNGANAYMYAIKNQQNKLIPSTVMAHSPGNRTLVEQNFLSSVPYKLSFNAEQRSAANSIKKSTTGTTASFPSTGSHKMLIILVEFTDVPFQSGGRVYFDSLANGKNFTENGATGSIWKYYSDNSLGKLDLNAVVVGPYTLSKDMAYYGANNSVRKDVNVAEMIKEAVNLADADVNYADFDNDNDGTVDNVYVIYSGYAEAQGGGENTIWPHASSLSNVTKDGKKMGRYACSSELRGRSGTNKAGIGTICHEFGHVLSFPDFYDTDYEANGQAFDVGPWDLMASGSYNNDERTPPYLTAYERNMLGWMDFTVLNSVSIDNTLGHVGTSNKGYRFDTKTNGEFFILENRQQKGWDAYIPGHGMLIYHVDLNVSGWRSNQININADHQGFDIEEADNIQTDNTRAGDPFPGTTGVNSFTDYTTPNAKSWAGQNTGKPITNITEINDTIYFDFMVDPMIITEGFSNVKSESAVVSGITAQKTDFFVEKGICYSTSPFPNVSDSIRTSTSTGTNYSCTLSPLKEATTYYAKAYVKDTAGKYYYGDQVSFTTSTYFSVVTRSVDTIKVDYIVASGTYTSYESGPTVIEKGICFSKNNNPDTSMGKVQSLSTSSPFFATAKDLASFASYNARAYIISSYGKIYYGASVAFSTLADERFDIITNAASELKSVSAKVSASFTMVKGEATAYGICYNTKTNPTINQNRVQGTDTSKVFTCSLSGLTPATTYYARAYVKGESGSYYYGNEITFKTLDKENFAVQTIDAEVHNNNVIATGTTIITTGTTIESRGFCYSSKHNPPTLNDLIVEATTQSDTFHCNLGSLSHDSIYYIRAYAIGINGTIIYGNVFTLGNTDGINDLSKTLSCNIYPNPSRGIINMNFQGLENKNVTIFVKNILGQIVYVKENIAIYPDYTMQLDLSTLSEGTYFISVSDKNMLISKKLILTK